jgi:hypothetical protein
MTNYSHDVPVSPIFYNSIGFRQVAADVLYNAQIDWDINQAVLVGDSGAVAQALFSTISLPSEEQGVRF